MSPEQLEFAKTYYQNGKEAFERGRYRQSVQNLEKAVSLVARSSRLGGEMQIWLVIAYEAAGDLEAAIALCNQVSRHPHLDTAKQGKRLLYILKAPRLKTRPEWLTQIPDLTTLDDDQQQGQGLARYRDVTPKRPRLAPPKQPEPIDWSQVNTKDNQFIWVALIGIVLTLGGLIWAGYSG
jgi:tetratricopeptide (TPR) repeat protein